MDKTLDDFQSTKDSLAGCESGQSPDDEGFTGGAQYLTLAFMAPRLQALYDSPSRVDDDTQLLIDQALAQGLILARRGRY